MSGTARRGRWARAAAAAVPGLGLAGSVLAPAAASTSPDDHDMSGMDVPAETPTASTSAAAHEDSDVHADLPQGKRTWTHPELLAQAATVRIETVADVYIAVHHDHLHKFHFPDLRDPATAVTGTYINDRGSVVTNSAALRLDDDQRRRFGILAVNQAFTKLGFLKAMPKDPFSLSSIGSNRGPNADEPPTRPPMSTYLKSCYELGPSVHCAVFVTLHLRVFPSIDGAPADGLEGRPQLQPDEKVSVLDIATDPARVPLTLQLSNPPRGQQYRVITASDDAARLPRVSPPGTLTGDENKPLSTADLKKLYASLGPQGAGSSVVTPRGDLVAMLGMSTDGRSFQAVPGSHLSNDLKRYGVNRNASTTDADFRDGVDLFEDSQFGAALPRLKAAVQATGGQLVAKQLAEQAASKDGTSADLSDEADAPSGAAVTSAGDSRWWLWTGSGVLVLLLAGAGLVAVRRRAPNGPEGHPEEHPGTRPGTPTTILGKEHAPATEQTAVRQVPAAAGSVTTRFCRQCGAQLSPGDRFCFSCGGPAGSG